MPEMMAGPWSGVDGDVLLLIVADGVLFSMMFKMEVHWELYMELCSLPHLSLEDSKSY